MSEIKEWFEKQRNYHFYSSSIIIAYESDLETINSNEKDTLNEIDTKVRLAMIDFTHVYPAQDQPDSNYLFGLNNLLNLLNTLLN